MDKASKPKQNQNREADRSPRAGSPRGVGVATGRILKFFKDFALLGSVLPLSPWPVATAPGSDFVSNRMKHVWTLKDLFTYHRLCPLPFPFGPSYIFSGFSAAFRAKLRKHSFSLGDSK